MSEHPGKSDEHVQDQQIRDQALRLFTFLRELTELRTKTIRTSDQYERVLWFHEIPRESDCYCPAWAPPDADEQAEIWLEVKKPRLKRPPKPPEALEPWLNLREVEESSREFPPLRDRITIAPPDEPDGPGEVEQQPAFRDLADSPEIRSLWHRYLEEKWKPWAGEDRRLQAVQKVYTDLFSIYQKQQRLGEAYEVVLGLGYLTWKVPGGHDIRRHIITAQTSLSFDATRGLITVGPAAEGAKTTLEQDMLEPQERPDPPVLNAIDQQVTEIGEALWDSIQVQAALQAWVHAVSARGQFDQTLNPPSDVSSDPRIHLAPALILRKRTDRSLLRVYQEIIQQLRAGQTVPLGVSRLVAIIDDAIPMSDEDTTTSYGDEPSALTTEIYFPLPANDEQLEIVRRLSTRQGVLVQGPPGTGKSHTIANLVCHLLATGQRVLVTSHTARALKVLQDKFPKEIAALCVILLGDDLNAMRSLEDSVIGITDRHNTWHPEKERALIAQLESELDEARRAEAATLAQLFAVRETQTYRHPIHFEAYEGTAQAIAGRLREEEPRYRWLPVSPAEDDEPPLSDQEAVELITTFREIDSIREEELLKPTIDLASLVSPRDFVELVTQESRAATQYKTAAGARSHPTYSVLTHIPRERRTTAAARLLDLRTMQETLSRQMQPWAQQALNQILTGGERAWRDLEAITKEHLAVIGDRAHRASERQISGLGERKRSLVKAHALALLEHLKTGGKLGVGFFRPKVVRECIYLIKEVLLDGHRCNSPEQLRNLLEWIEVADSLNALRTHWSAHTKPFTGPFSAQVASYRHLCDQLSRTLEVQSKVAAAKEVLSGIAGLPEPTWDDPQALAALESALEAVTVEERLKEARSRFEALESHLRAALVNPNIHPLIRQTLEAVGTRDESRYGETHFLLSNLEKSREKLERRRLLLQRLEAAAPELGGLLASTIRDPVWDGRMRQFTAAWNWARADLWLRRLNDPEVHTRLSRQLMHHRTRIRGCLRDLAAAKAWKACFARLTEHERQHLMAWTKAMRRIGKGKGKYAPMHRRAAREHMEQCRSAIPAWIMPIYRVAESVRPGKDTFDFVIVDEASQSGPEALFLHYLARKIIVVGDDKQISPDFVGMAREAVELLRQRHIADLPHSDALGVDNSFFDQAEIRYGGRIRLREHFRCMPEIIQFSNNLCYQSEPLVPLRQYGVGRLRPIIVTRHVPDGYPRGQSPRVVNAPEAEAIVDQIRRCCDDPAYAGKTMGVISLLGEDQARLIEKRLLEKLGPEEMEARHLVCGDSYAFQGDERDVMFLSLVSAPSEGRRVGTLASPRDERRFNVAASRAKDQMWLFHTATLNDLSPNCLRFRLLHYCQNPQVETAALQDLNVEEIRTISRSVNRDRETPPSPFGSWFEVDVFLKISERGYRVLPQFAVAGRHIDLVVEGMQGRLAVECDGDAWHGAERYDQDMARERMLERCGWTFWRVGGSTFYRDPEAALEGLWNTLKRLGIHPTSGDVGSGPTDGAASRHGVSPPGGPEEEEMRPSVMTGIGRIEKKPASDRGVNDEERHVGHEAPADAGLIPATSLPERKQKDLWGQAAKADKRSMVCLSLIPYRTWTPRALPDPRSVPIDEVVPGLTEIIAAEGPMLCLRAYQIYAKAAGIDRVGRQIRSIFNRAVRKAIRLRVVEEQNEHGTPGQMNQIVRKGGTPAVVARRRGPRKLDEVPPAEVSEMMISLRTQEPGLSDEALLQSVLTHFEIARMTANIRQLLMRIKDRYVDRRG